MDKEIMKGFIDILLLALLSKHEKYCMKRIRKSELKAIKMGEGTIYPALKIMEQKGWITSVKMKIWYREKIL